MKRATTLCETAKRIGLKKGSLAAEYEMKLLLADCEYKMAQLDSIMEEIKSLCKKIPESEQVLAIKGIGVITVAGVPDEVGDVRRFESPRQIQKLAGLSLNRIFAIPLSNINRYPHEAGKIRPMVSRKSGSM